MMSLVIGQLIDKLYAHDQAIAKINAQLRDAKAARALIEKRLFKKFNDDELDGAVGGKARATITKREHPNIKDRRKFMRYIIKNKAYDLLQNRILAKAYFDRREEGENVPGVEVFTSTRISVTKK